MKRPTINPDYLAWGMARAAPESALHGRLPERSSRWKRWLPVWLVPLLGLIVFQVDFVRFINWWLS